MRVKKIFKVLRNFRVGIEGNISELKQAFCAGRAELKKKMVLRLCLVIGNHL
tara:strand:+ start:1189 stop:1344 length:156 start_codon:yes stop_codon:yes gene_type:complete